MKRREFIALVGGAAAAWPLAVRAQQAPLPIVAVLSSASPESAADRLKAFREGLVDSGYAEGKNVMLEFHFAYDQYDRLSALAEELVRRHVSVIAAVGNLQPILAAKKATSTIPIVFAMGGDPTQLGLANFNRPVGNVTGITQYAFVLATKRMQVLHDLVPKARKFGILINPSNLRASTLESVRPAIQAFGGTIEVGEAATESDFDAAFAGLAQKGVEALSVVPESLFSTRAERLVALAARYAIPTIYADRESAAAGGLCSYGASIPASYRQAGAYAARILKGEKPEDLPIVGPTQFDLVINLKTAKALALDVSPQLLAIADEVIE